MKQVLVQDIMTPMDRVITISPLAKVRELLQLMQEKNVKSVVVERSNVHDAFGLVTYTSVLHAIFAEDGDMDLINVYDIVAKPIISVRSELDIRYAAKMMVQHKVNRLLVTNNNELLGLVSMNDIVQVLMEEAAGE